jgi:hypothetical protein
MCYVGIGQNRLPGGQPIILESDDKAFAYALHLHGIQPCDNTQPSYEFREMFLEWEFSGDWVKYPSLDDYAEEQNELRRNGLAS